MREQLGHQHAKELSFVVAFEAPESGGEASVAFALVFDERDTLREGGDILHAP